MVPRVVNNENCKELEDKVAEAIIANFVDVASGQKVVDWRSLFATSSNQSPSYFSTRKLNGRVVVSPPKDVFEESKF